MACPLLTQSDIRLALRLAWAKAPYDPAYRSSPSACGTDRGKQAGRIGVRDDCCAIIKPANIIPKYLAKMLWRELAREGRA
jgi:hypothetical protein